MKTRKYDKVVDRWLLSKTCPCFSCLVLLLLCVTSRRAFQGTCRNRPTAHHADHYAPHSVVLGSDKFELARTSCRSNMRMWVLDDTLVDCSFEQPPTSRPGRWTVPGRTRQKRSSVPWLLDHPNTRDKRVLRSTR